MFYFIPLSFSNGRTILPFMSQLEISTVVFFGSIPEPEHLWWMCDCRHMPLVLTNGGVFDSRSFLQSLLDQYEMLNLKLGHHFPLDRIYVDLSSISFAKDHKAIVNTIEDMSFLNNKHNVLFIGANKDDIISEFKFSLYSIVDDDGKVNLATI